MDDDLNTILSLQEDEFLSMPTSKRQWLTFRVARQVAKQPGICAKKFITRGQVKLVAIAFLIGLTVAGVKYHPSILRFLGFL
jgi:hypothetical protein